MQSFWLRANQENLSIISCIFLSSRLAIKDNYEDDKETSVMLTFKHSLISKVNCRQWRSLVCREKKVVWLFFPIFADRDMDVDR